MLRPGREHKQQETELQPLEVKEKKLDVQTIVSILPLLDFIKNPTKDRSEKEKLELKGIFITLFSQLIDSMLNVLKTYNTTDSKRQRSIIKIATSLDEIRKIRSSDLDSTLNTYCIELGRQLTILFNETASTKQSHSAQIFKIKKQSNLEAQLLSFLDNPVYITLLYAFHYAPIHRREVDPTSLLQFIGINTDLYTHLNQTSTATSTSPARSPGMGQRTST